MATPFVSGKPRFQVKHGLEKKRSSTKDFKVFPMTEDHIGEALLRVRARSGVQGK